MAPYKFPDRCISADDSGAREEMVPGRQWEYLAYDHDARNHSSADG